ILSIEQVVAPAAAQDEARIVFVPELLADRAAGSDGDVGVVLKTRRGVDLPGLAAYGRRGLRRSGPGHFAARHLLGAGKLQRTTRGLEVGRQPERLLERRLRLVPAL